MVDIGADVNVKPEKSLSKSLDGFGFDAADEDEAGADIGADPKKSIFEEVDGADTTGADDGPKKSNSTEADLVGCCLTAGALLPKSPKASTGFDEEGESAKGSKVFTWLGLLVSLGVFEETEEEVAEDEEATGVDAFFSYDFGVSVFFEEENSDGGSNLEGLFWKSWNATPSIVKV